MTNKDDSGVLLVVWVVLRRSQNPHHKDVVTVAFQSYDRAEAEEYIDTAREVVAKSWFPGSSIYELAEC